MCYWLILIIRLLINSKIKRKRIRHLDSLSLNLKIIITYLPVKLPKDLSRHNKYKSLIYSTILLTLNPYYLRIIRTIIYLLHNSKSHNLKQIIRLLFLRFHSFKITNLIYLLHHNLMFKINRKLTIFSIMIKNKQKLTYLDKKSKKKLL